MVKSVKGTHKTTVVLSPNLSMRWRINVCLMFVVALWAFMIGCGFWIIGAWPILPFLGVDVICLGAGLWYTHKKLNCKEVLSIGDTQVLYEQGVMYPNRRIK